MLEQDITRFRSLFTSIRDAVFIADSDGAIIMANPSSEIITGILPDDLIGKNLRDALACENKKTDASAFLVEALKGDRAVELAPDSYLCRSDGSLLPIGATATPLYGQDGRFTGIVVIARDLSAEVRLKQRQYEFIAFAAHQLRQPFTSLRLGLEMMDDPATPLDPSQKEIINELLQIVLRFLSFIKDLMQIAGLEEGLIEIKKQAVDIRGIAQSVAAEIKGIAVSQNVEILLFPTASPADSFVILCDPERLSDILRNLMGNAIRYNRPRGTVTVDAQIIPGEKLGERLGASRNAARIINDLRSRTAPGGLWIIATVADTGMGIPADQQSRIFESFFRASNVSENGLQGTGLGLSIAKSLVELTGGRITFSSHENVGTTFFIVYPAYI